VNLYTFARTHRHRLRKRKRNDPEEQHESNAEDTATEQAGEEATRSGKDRLVVHRRLSAHDGDLYAWAMLLLYTPWRREAELIAGFDTAAAALDAKRHIVEEWLRKEDQEEVLRSVCKAMDTAMAASFIDLDPSVASQAGSAADVLDPVGAHRIVNEIRGMVEAAFDGAPVAPIGDVDTDGDDPFPRFVRMVGKLNAEQRAFVHRVWDWSISTSAFLAGTGAKPAPMHLFLSGFGGTGKSFCIGTVAEMLRLVFGVSSACPHFLMAAPTGIAAILIGGSTLHSLFALPVHHHASQVFV